MTAEAQQAKKRRLDLARQLEEAAKTELDLIRPEAEQIAERALDSLEIPFCNGDARKVIVSTIGNLLTNLAISEKADLPTAQRAVRKAADLCDRWLPTTGTF